MPIKQHILTIKATKTERSLYLIVIFDISSSIQLWETTLDPETRALVQVRIEDDHETERTFDKLMGGEVPPRRAFIEENALNVSNLDI